MAVSGPRNGMWGKTAGNSAINAAKTHCLNGHPFDEENTHWRKTRSGIGRDCRKCAAARKRKRMAKKRAMTKKYGSMEAYRIAVQANRYAMDDLQEIHKNEFNKLLFKHGGYIPEPPARICQADNCDNVIPDSKRSHALYCQSTCKRRAYRVAKWERERNCDVV